MSIIPISSALVPYARPLWPIQLATPHYRSLYPYFQYYPTVYSQPPTYLVEPSHPDVYEWQEDTDYKIIDAIHNPGSFWIWPAGQ